MAHQVRGICCPSLATREWHWSPHKGGQRALILEGMLSSELHVCTTACGPHPHISDGIKKIHIPQQH